MDVFIPWLAGVVVEWGETQRCGEQTELIRVGWKRFGV